MSVNDQNAPESPFTRQMNRRGVLRALGVGLIGAPFATALGQGRCRLKLGSVPCDTTAIKPMFGATGFRTISIEHITMQVADYQKEAAFYAALMGWTQRSDDGRQAIMDIGSWGSVLLQQAPASASAPVPAPAPPADTGGRGGRGGGAGRAPVRATVESVCYGIANWNAKKVETELKARGLIPVAENDGKGFESFHVKDPDGFNVQISNGEFAKRRKNATSMTPASPAPFESTGWKTVWLDHFSYNVANYKESANFYMNLLGWKPTYDEGSQNELLIGDVGNIIIRGGNPLDPTAGQGGRGGGAGTTPNPARRARIDHISFGIDPWDTDGVKAALEKRGLRARVDTSTDDEIHVAAFKSYHTTTPNGYDLQISAVHGDARLTLSNAVRPRRPAQ